MLSTITTVSKMYVWYILGQIPSLSSGGNGCYGDGSGEYGDYGQNSWYGSGAYGGSRCGEYGGGGGKDGGNYGWCGSRS